MKTPSLLTTLALVLPFAGTVFAGSYSWNAGTGYWTNAANWLPVGVPTETDTVIVGTGRVYLPTDPTLALDDFHLHGGEIRGTFDVRGLCEWTNGVIALGTNTVRTNAVLRLVGDATKTFAAVILNNEGWVAWANDGRIDPQGNCEINNHSGGIFEARGDGSVYKTSAGVSSFNNYGLFRKTGGTNSTWFTSVPFNNSGAVEIQTGTLRLNSGGTLSGSLVAWPDSQIELAGGNFLLDGEVTAIRVKVSGGTVKGTNALHGQVNWTSGGFSSGVTTVATNCTLRLWDETEKFLSSHGLNNEGWLIWSNNCRLTPAGNCLMSNLPNGTFEVQGDGSIDRSGSAGSCTFHNLGTFRKSGGTGQTRIVAVPFVNSGATEVLTGALVLSSGGSLGGAIIATNGAEVLLTGGTFALGDELTAVNLRLAGGTMGGTGALHGQVNWTSGSLASGVTTVATNCTLRLWDDTEKALASHVLNNEGWLIWSNSCRLTPAGTCVISNQPGGTFEVWGDGSIDRSGSAGSCTFHNLGTFRKSGGTGQTRIVAVPFVNSGATEVLTGALVLSSGGSLGGTIVATNGAEVLLTGGTFALGDELTAVNLRLAGGTIGGIGTLHGQVNWTSGGFSSGITTVATNCTLRLWDETEKFLSSHGLNNEGWLVWSNNCRLTPAGTGVISNLPSGTFEVWGDGSIDRSGSAGSCTFHNLGTFRKSGGTGQTRIVAVPFVNSGATEVLTGALVLSSGGSLGGTIVATNGAEVLLTGGTFALGDELTAVNLRLAGGTIGGIGTLHGQVNWTSGSLANGVTTVATNCTLRLWDDTEKALASHVLNNEGWLIWSNSCRLTPAGTCVISNQPGGTFEVWGDGSIDRSGYAGSCTFHNLGTFRKTGGTGQTRVTALPFINQGHVEARVGTLRFDTGYTQTSGTTWLAGGGVSAATPLDIQGGSVTGSGDIAASLKNGGLVSPGNSVGQINVLTDYTQTAAGTLRIEIAGRNPGQFDQMNVSGSAALDGTLTVTLTNGFTPAPGDTFPILTCSSRTGSFAVTNGLALGNGTSLAVEYRADGVFLVATGQVAGVTIASPTVSGTNFGFSLSTIADKTYTIQATEAIGSGDWTNVMTIIGDGTVQEALLPLLMHSQRFYRVRISD